MNLKMAHRDLENATERRRRLARERYAAKQLIIFERARAYLGQLAALGASLARVELVAFERFRAAKRAAVARERA